jgi:hypothetical protein
LGLLLPLFHATDLADGKDAIPSLVDGSTGDELENPTFGIVRLPAEPDHVWTIPVLKTIALRAIVTLAFRR